MAINQLLAHIQTHTPHVILLQETLTRVNKRPKLPGYTVHHLPWEHHEPQGSRGMVTAVRNDVPHTPPVNLRQGSTCTQSFTINTGQACLTLTNLYTHPGNNTDLRTLVHNSPHHIICGDFNASSPIWSGTPPSKAGEDLADQLGTLPTVLLTDPKVPTCTTGSTIDLAFVAPDIAARSFWTQAEDLTSDHIASVLNVHDARPDIPALLIPRWALSRADWTLYAALLEVEARDLLFVGDLDKDYGALSEAITRAAQASIPRTRGGPCRRRHLFLPPEAARWTNLMSQATKAYKSNRCDSTHETLRAVQHEARSKLRDLREASWCAWARSLETKSTTEIWTIVGRLRGATPRTLNVDPEAEANRLAEHFTTRADATTLPQHTRDEQDLLSPQFRERVDRALLESADSDCPFTLDELNEAIRHSRNTAPGDDTLTYAFLHRAPTSFRAKLLELCNISWDARRLPLACKRALVVPIPKPGGAGHRPISLLHCAGKTMERMVTNRLTWIRPHTPLMYGFVPGRSTTDAISQVISDITDRRGPKTRKPVVVVFLDLDKAFERVLPLPALDALVSLGVRGTMLGWIQDYLSNRSARVRVQGYLSDPHPITSGVPQGSVIAPSLFNAVVSTILSAAATPGTRIVAYADDLALVASGKTPFRCAQRALHRLAAATRRAGLMVSPAKTKAMTFHTRLAPVLTLDGQPVEYVTHYKYLGVVIDRQLSFDRHVTHLRAKVISRINIMRILGGILHGLSTSMLLVLYKSLVESVLLYGAPALLMAGRSPMASLERLQRSALRTALGLPSTSPILPTMEESGVLPIKVAIHNTTVRYIIKASLHPSAPPAIECVWRDQHKDPRVFPPTTWSLRAGTIMTSRAIIRPINPATRASWRPWDPLPVENHIDNSNPKAEDPQAAAAAANLRILGYENADAFSFYTDASQLSTGVTTWAVSSSLGDSYGRLADHTPITLAELTAIVKALQSFEDSGITAPLLVVHSDSLGALQIATNRRAAQYHETLTELWTTAARLRAPVVLHWVPSHTGIPGNEAADRLAGRATLLQDQDPTEVVPGTFNHRLAVANQRAKAIFYRPHEGKPSAIWYRACTGPDIRGPLGSRQLDCQLRRLRTWSLPWPNGKPPTCVACDELNNPVHYLVQCPAQPRLRRQLLLQLPQGVRNGDPKVAAQLLLRRAATNPSPLFALLHAQPYLKSRKAS